MDSAELYRRMLLIRRVEERVEGLFSQGLLRGTTHGSRGQEAIAVGLLSQIDCKKDYVTGSHRSHGHYLALNPDPYPFFAELMGKSTGLIGGRGGSQHLAYKNFITNGITGGMVPVACGLAFYQKNHTDEGICVSFFGDGAMNEGYVMEAFNLATVFQLPILFAFENNNFAMSTPFSYSCKGDIESRIHGFGLEYIKHKVLDVHELYSLTGEVISEIRKKRKPVFMEFETHRFSGHSKSDNRDYIPASLDQFWVENDPLEKIKNQLSESLAFVIKNEVNDEVERAIGRAIADPIPSII